MEQYECFKTECPECGNLVLFNYSLTDKAESLMLESGITRVKANSLTAKQQTQKHMLKVENLLTSAKQY